MKLKNLIMCLSLLAAMNANAEVISLVSTSTPPANTKTGEPYDIYGYHEIHIINASINNETMNYSYQICMDGICNNTGNNITVYPRQHWDNTRVSHIRVKMSKGKHYYTVRTECGKEKTSNTYEVNVR